MCVYVSINTIDINRPLVALDLIAFAELRPPAGWKLSRSTIS